MMCIYSATSLYIVTWSIVSLDLLHRLSFIQLVWCMHIFVRLHNRTLTLNCGQCLTWSLFSKLCSRSSLGTTPGPWPRFSLCTPEILGQLFMGNMDEAWMCVVHLHVRVSTHGSGDSEQNREEEAVWGLLSLACQCYWILDSNMAI